MSDPIRFCQNNMAAASGATLTASSAVDGFPVANSVAQQRYKRWLAKGSFRVTTSNKKLYIDDGSTKTITLTEGVYATGALLAAHVVTQLNASSSNWTGSYSSSTYKFTFGRSSGTATFRLTQTTDAAWSMLGYTGSSDDDLGTGQAADQQRNHTSERWSVDLGVARNAKAFFVIGEADTDFCISSTATCVLKGSTVNDYDTASYSVALTRESTGIFKFFDQTLRYWWFDFDDKLNPAGPQSFGLKIYLGDYIAPTTRNLNLGFVRSLIDPSLMQESESGVLYARRRPKYWTISSNNIEWLSGDDRTELERCLREMGQATPFFVSLDPGAEISASLGEFTKYVVFDGTPSITHLKYNHYAINFAMREVVG